MRLCRVLGRSKIGAAAGCEAGPASEAESRFIQNQGQVRQGQRAVRHAGTIQLLHPCASTFVHAKPHPLCTLSMSHIQERFNELQREILKRHVKRKDIVSIAPLPSKTRSFALPEVSPDISRRRDPHAVPRLPKSLSRIIRSPRKVTVPHTIYSCSASHLLASSTISLTNSPTPPSPSKPESPPPPIDTNINIKININSRIGKRYFRLWPILVTRLPSAVTCFCRL